MKNKTLCLLLILISFCANAQESTTDKINELWKDYEESDLGIQDRQRQIDNNKQFFDFAKSQVDAFKNSFEKVNAIKQENFKTVANLLIPYLYNRKDTSQESKFLLAELVLYEPRLLDYVDSINYNTAQAKQDLQELATIAKHPGAEFSVGAAYFDWRNPSLPATKMVQDAAAQSHFGAISKMGTNEIPPTLPFLYLDATGKIKPENYEPLLEHLLNTYDYESLIYLTGYNNDFKLFITKKQKTLNKSNYTEIAKAYLKVFGQLQTQTWSNKYKSFSVDQKSVDEFAKIVEVTHLTDSTAGRCWKTLADIYSDVFWVTYYGAHYYLCCQGNTKKAQEYYQKSYELGNLESQYRLACLLGKWEYGVSKDESFLKSDNFSKSIELLMDLERKGYKGAFLQLAEMYEFGLGIKKDLDKANKYYEQQFKKLMSYEALLGLYRLGKSNMSRQYPIPFMLDGSEIRECLHAIPKNVKIIHFWHQGFSADEYIKTIRLAKEFNESKYSHIAFAAQNRNGDTRQILQATGYKGIIFEVAERDKKFNSERQAYRSALFGANNPFSEKLAENFGDILPEFDPRWAKQGLPATFVYVDNENKSYYFPASVPVDEIIHFIHSKELVPAKVEPKVIEKRPAKIIKKPIKKVTKK